MAGFSQRWFLILFLVGTSWTFAFSQQFSLVNAGLVGVGRSSVAWGDYDNDGDLDILVTGNPGSGPYIASVYRNDEGNFVNINAGLTGIDNSSVAWGDYDNDGDLDILATGRSSGSTATWLYRNDNGAFYAVSAGLPAIGSYGSVAWGDVDGDGDLDMLISGNYMTKLFRNQNGVFENMNVLLPAVSNSFVTIGDYDNDGDQDLFIMGDLGGWPVSAVCMNIGRAFIELDSTGIMPLASGSASWVDYDHDHDLDVLVNGFDQYLEPKTSVFRNNGGMSFSNTWPGLPGSALGTVAWGDYDNDGDADIIMTGQNAACGSLSSMVFRNDGNDNFTDINAPLDGAERGTAAWGDYDNDGDLDILLCGFNGSGLAITKLYRNTNGSNAYAVNEPPASPSGLNSVVTGNTVSFAWIETIDHSTPEESLSYNLRVGTSPGGQDILAADSDPVSSGRLIPSRGNVSDNTGWTLMLEDGTYYWSVQAVDHGYKASAYASEQQLEVITVGVPDEQEGLNIKVRPNPFSTELSVSGLKPFSLEISNMYGIRKYASPRAGLSFQIPTSNWPAGTYVLSFCEGNSFSRQLVIKK